MKLFHLFDDLSYKKKINYYFNVVVVVLITLSSLVFYSKLCMDVDMNKRKDLTNTAALLTNAGSIMLDETKSVMLNIEFDTEIRTLSKTFDSLDYRTSANIMNNIGNLLTSKIYFENGLIYFPEEKQVFNVTRRTIYPLTDESEIEYIKNVSEGLNRSTTEQDMLAQMISYKGVPQLTIAKRLNGYAADLAPFTVVQIGDSYFKRLLSEIKLTKDEFLGIYDCNFNSIVFLNDSGNQFKETVQSQIAQYSFSHNETHSISINGSKYSVMTRHSPQYGWTFISGVPNKKMLLEKVTFGGITLFIAFVILYFSFKLTRRISMKLYSPVFNFTQTLSIDDELLTERDDIDLIDKYIRTIMEDNVLLKDSLKKNVEVIKRNEIIKILKNKESYDDSLWDKINQYGIDIPDNAVYCVCIIYLEDYKNATFAQKNKNDEFVDVLLNNMLHKIKGASPEMSCEFIQEESDRITIVLGVKNKPHQNAEHLFQAAITGIYNDLIEYFAGVISIGQGRICHDIQYLKNSYREARTALEYRTIAGNNLIIHINSVPEVENNFFVYPFEIEREIFIWIKQLNQDGAKEGLKRYFKYINSNITSDVLLSYAYNQLLDTSIRSMSQMSIDITTIFNGTSPYQQLASLSTDGNVEQWFEEIFVEMINCISAKRNDKAPIIIDSMKKFIDENYSDYSLSIDSLATQMHFSTSYLSKIFKEITNTSIKEYVTIKRIEKAKELLLTTDLKIKRIAEQIGYTNDRSFINVFKKHIGETPGDYRDIYLKLNVTHEINEKHPTS